MNRVKAIMKLREIVRDLENKEFYDQENAHVDADDVLCELLIYFGFKEVVEEYHRIPKWYA